MSLHRRLSRSLFWLIQFFIHTHTHLLLSNDDIAAAAADDDDEWCCRLKINVYYNLRVDLVVETVSKKLIF